MWCHIGNSDETHIQRILPSPKVALDNHTPPSTTPPPKKKEWERERVSERERQRERKKVHQILCWKRKE
jgi:hypothetical protein